ncbi:MAG: type II toxin-antitoxin system VapC family toxin [Reyranella sp.]|uniref:type II toxin-antitoxin system VapC family toxin n=1 Tax=Reyranella sp. TaxID=1929291 RepID=UPI003D0A2123
MTLLLDTHTIVWLTEDFPELGNRTKRSCDAALASSEIAVSTIVFFALGQLARRRCIAGPESVSAWRARLITLDVQEIPVSADIALRAAQLGELHGDPIDRIIVATAIVEGALLSTADRRILDWPGSMQRQDARR